MQAVLDEFDPLIRQQDEQHVQQHLGQLLSKQGGGSSMGGSPKVSLSTPGGTVSSKADTDDTTNQL